MGTWLTAQMTFACELAGCDFGKWAQSQILIPIMLIVLSSGEKANVAENLWVEQI